MHARTHTATTPHRQCPARSAWRPPTAAPAQTHATPPSSPTATTRSRPAAPPSTAAACASPGRRLRRRLGARRRRRRLRRCRGTTPPLRGRPALCAAHRPRRPQVLPLLPGGLLLLLLHGGLLRERKLLLRRRGGRERLRPLLRRLRSEARASAAGCRCRCCCWVSWGCSTWCSEICSRSCSSGVRTARWSRVHPPMMRRKWRWGRRTRWGYYPKSRQRQPRAAAPAPRRAPWAASHPDRCCRPPRLPLNSSRAGLPLLLPAVGCAGAVVGGAAGTAPASKLAAGTAAAA